MPDTGVFKFIEELLTKLFGFVPPDWLLRIIGGNINWTFDTWDRNYRDSDQEIVGRGNTALALQP